jgi:DNA-binding LacI/PurR family transcriptional regulator/signal transduction histidine kinase
MINSIQLQHDSPVPTIGVFTAQLNDAYQRAVWTGIEKRALEAGAGLVCFVGRRIDAPVVSEATANIVYKLADGSNLNGLIVISNTIATYLEKKDIGNLFSCRAGLPQVSLGFTVPGIPSISVDGSEAIASVVRHLIRDHRCSRFALLGGPPRHAEAEEREHAFRKVLREESIPFDERLLVKGDFVIDSGVEATVELLNRKIPFDALFCMNDRMALGALEVLHSRGIQIPDDLAVIGFDGIEESRYNTPPLTTVVQPLTELGAAAVDTILESLAGKKPQNKVLKCRPVIRQSCGCLPDRPFDHDLSEIPDDAEDSTKTSIQSLIMLYQRTDYQGFIGCLNTDLSKVLREDGDIGHWQNYISIVRNTLKEEGLGLTEKEASVFEYARALIGEMESRQQGAGRIAAENKLIMLRTISAALSGAFQMALMLDRLESSLKELGIGDAFLALFETEDSDVTWSRLILALAESEKLEIPEGGIRFRTTRLLPLCIAPQWKREHWVLAPLVYENEPLGYMMLPGGVEDPSIYDTLCKQVASAFKGALLLNQVRSHERRLEEEVERRTAELRRTNQELLLEVQRRMSLEQEVLEISNQTMQRIGQDLHDDLCQQLAGIAMYASVLGESLKKNLPEAHAAMLQIDDLLSDSIKRIKQIARGLYPTGLAEYGLVSAVEELIDSARRSYGISIDFTASPRFKIPDTDQALQIYRITQEALSNALKHSGSDRIRVSFYPETGNHRNREKPFLITEVIDYGKGLPDKIPEGGMGLRIMKYRAETADAEYSITQLHPGTRVQCRIAVKEEQDD